MISNSPNNKYEKEIMKLPKMMLTKWRQTGLNKLLSKLYFPSRIIMVQWLRYKLLALTALLILKKYAIRPHPNSILSHSGEHTIKKTLTHYLHEPFWLFWWLLMENCLNSMGQGVHSGYHQAPSAQYFLDHVHLILFSGD